MNDLIDDVRVTGRILLDGEDILRSELDVIQLRRRVGMVFQKPTPFPKSIFENVAYGLRIGGNGGRPLWTRWWRRASAGRPSGTK